MIKSEKYPGYIIGLKQEGRGQGTTFKRMT